MDPTHYLRLASLRYYGTVTKNDGTWLFSERLLYVDWIDNRVLQKASG